MVCEGRGRASCRHKEGSRSGAKKTDGTQQHGRQRHPILEPRMSARRCKPDDRRRSKAPGPRGQRPCPSSTPASNRDGDRHGGAREDPDAPDGGVAGIRSLAGPRGEKRPKRQPTRNHRPQRPPKSAAKVHRRRHSTVAFPPNLRRHPKGPQRRSAGLLRGQARPKTGLEGFHEMILEFGRHVGRQALQLGCKGVGLHGCGGWIPMCGGDDLRFGAASIVGSGCRASSPIAGGRRPSRGGREA